MNEDYRQTWRATKFRGPDEKSIEEVLDGKRTTALQRLARRYKRFSAVSSAAIAASLLFLSSSFIPEERRLLTTLCFGLYFFIAAIMDMWLSNGIESIDCNRMKVSEVAAKAIFYRKRHFQFMAILMPMAFGLMALLAWNMADNIYCIAGIAIGFLFGLALGLGELRRFLADYRDLI